MIEIMVFCIFIIIYIICIKNYIIAKREVEKIIEKNKNKTSLKNVPIEIIKNEMFQEYIRTGKITEEKYFEISEIREKVTVIVPDKVKELSTRKSTQNIDSKTYNVLKNNPIKTQKIRNNEVRNLHIQQDLDNYENKIEQANNNLTKHNLNRDNIFNTSPIQEETFTNLENYSKKENQEAIVDYENDYKIRKKNFNYEQESNYDPIQEKESFLSKLLKFFK